MHTGWPKPLNLAVFRPLQGISGRWPFLGDRPAPPKCHNLQTSAPPTSLHGGKDLMSRDACSLYIRIRHIRLDLLGLRSGPTWPFARGSSRLGVGRAGGGGIEGGRGTGMGSDLAGREDEESARDARASRPRWRMPLPSSSFFMASCTFSSTLLPFRTLATALTRGVLLVTQHCTSERPLPKVLTQRAPPGRLAA